MIAEKPSIVVDFEMFVPSLHTIEIYIDIIHAEEKLEEKEFNANTEDLSLTEEEMQYLENLMDEVNTTATNLYI